MSIRVIATVVSLLPNLNQKRLRQSLIVLVAGLFLLATFDADARRRALRVEFLDWTNPVLVVPSADCPGTSSTNSLVVEPVKASVGLDMTGFVFDSSDNALLLNGRYCQEGNRFTGSEFSDEYLNAESFDRSVGSGPVHGTAPSRHDGYSSGGIGNRRSHSRHAGE